MRLGYAEDVLNAAVAVRASSLPSLDGERIALLGRSMGGSVAFNALVARPGVFDAAIVYASTSTNAVDNFNRWQREDDRLRRAVFREHGSPSANPGFWRGISAVNYVDRITEPVLMFHGTRDESCPIAWARTTRDALVDAGVDVRLGRVPGSRSLHVRGVGRLDAAVPGVPRAAPGLTDAPCLANDLDARGADSAAPNAFSARSTQEYRIGRSDVTTARRAVASAARAATAGDRDADHVVGRQRGAVRLAGRQPERDPAGAEGERLDDATHDGQR